MINGRWASSFASAGLVVWAWLASVAHVVAQDATAPPPTSTDQKTIWVTSIIGFLSLLATQLFAIWRQNQETKAAERRRQWDLEDRERARNDLRQQYEAQRKETISTASEIARIHLQNTRRIVEEISKNTEITEAVGRKADAAYSAGNDFNRRMEEMRQQLFAKGTQIDTIEDVSKDTNEKVTELQESKP